jgi:hypothetical protein
MLFLATGDMEEQIPGSEPYEANGSDTSDQGKIERGPVCFDPHAHDEREKERAEETNDKLDHIGNILSS